MSNTATKETTDLHPAMAERVDEIDDQVRQWSDGSTDTDQEYLNADYTASKQATVPDADMDSNRSLDASDDGTALEGADVETSTDTDIKGDYDIARDEIYETDLLGEDSSLDLDKATDTDDATGSDMSIEDSSIGSGGDGSG